MTTTALRLGTLALRPADWWPWVRGTYVVAPGVLAGGVAGALVLVNSSPSEHPDPGADSLLGHGWLLRARSLSLPARVVMSVGFGAIVSTMQAGSLRADAGIEAWLFRRGVKHPRRWMAGTVAAATLLGELVETDHITPAAERNLLLGEVPTTIAGRSATVARNHSRDHPDQHDAT